MLSGTSNRVFVASPALLRALATPEQVRASLRACDLKPDADSAINRDWAAFDSRAATRQDLLVIAAGPDAFLAAPCPGKSDFPRVSLARGVQRWDQGRAFEPGREITTVMLLSKGRQLVPTMSEIRSVAIVGRPRGIEPQAALSQFRAMIPIAVLGPDSLGEFPRITVVVGSRDSAFRDSLQVPVPDARAVWNTYLPAMLIADNAPIGIVSDALRSYSAITNRPRDLQTLDSRIRLAQHLSAKGRIGEARATIDLALAEHPCMTLSSAMPPQLRTMVDERRPVARCTVTSASRLAATSLVPGAAFMATGRRSASIKTIAAVGAAFGAALGLNGASNAAYDRYRVAQSDALAHSSYSSASALRSGARAAAVAGATLWAVTSIKAALDERAHERDIARVRDYSVRF